MRCMTKVNHEVERARRIDERTESIAVAAARGEFEGILAEVRRLAELDHSVHPAHKGRWDGPEWWPVRIERNITTKAGRAFRRGDLTLAKFSATALVSGPTWTAYSWANQCDTMIGGGDASAFVHKLAMKARGL